MKAFISALPVFAATLLPAAQFQFEHRTLVVPDGFVVEQVAGPPLIDRPIMADFDEQGRLYVADWTSLDPWARETTDGAPGAATTDEASAKPSEGGDPTLPATNDTGAADQSGDPATDGSKTDAPSEDVDSPVGNATAGPTDAPDVTVAPRASGPPFVLERPRAVSGRTRDWVVRWSADGRAYAVWTAEPGSKARGSLVVRSAPSGDAPTGISLVDRVRAGRSFGLGDQRVAWVAPLADGDGELWVSADRAGCPFVHQLVRGAALPHARSIGRLERELAVGLGAFVLVFGE